MKFVRTLRFLQFMKIAICLIVSIKSIYKIFYKNQINYQEIQTNVYLILLRITFVITIHQENKTCKFTCSINIEGFRYECKARNTKTFYIIEKLNNKKSNILIIMNKKIIYTEINNFTFTYRRKKKRDLFQINETSTSNEVTTPTKPREKLK